MPRLTPRSPGRARWQSDRELVLVIAVLALLLVAVTAGLGVRNMAELRRVERDVQALRAARRPAQAWPALPIAPIPITSHRRTL